ncbi:MAG: glycosyltransferase family 2 protein [Pseudonocardia sp.]|nr:glycosyltransferase family 2 protein [Pseudonocardia sp.]
MLPGSFTPTVSVCIPVYNGETYLAETIRSVLDQTYGDFELVLLDNNCSDRSPEIMRSFTDPRIRIERNTETFPQPRNWNICVGHTRAPLVKMLCADDLLHPRCLELQVQPLLDDPGLAVVACRRHMIDEQSRVIVPRRGLSGLIGVHSAADVARKVVRNGANPIGEVGNVMFRRADFMAIGGWREDRQLVMDIDCFIRLLEYGEFLGQPETLAAFRIGSNSVTSDLMDEIYEAQRAMTEELGETPAYEVSGLDVRIGRTLAPLGRMRRTMLFKMSDLAARRDGRREDSPA